MMGSFNYSFGGEKIDTSSISIRMFFVKGSKLKKLLLGESTKIENPEIKKYLIRIYSVCFP